MSEFQVHIILFDVPNPANYGGIINVFYNAKALPDMVQKYISIASLG